MLFLDQYIQKWGIRIFYYVFVFLIVFRLFFADGVLLDQTISYVSYPFLQIHSGVCSSIDSIKTNFFTVHDLKNQLQNMHQRTDELEARIVELEQEALFHERTKELVSFSERYQNSLYLLTKVLMRKRTPQEHVLFVDAGSKKGMEENMIVVYKNNLVGRVIRVYPLYSEVAFISDKRCKVTAETYETQVEGMYEGQNEDEARLNFIPHFKQVSVGEHLYSAGKGLLYPQGFLLGSVTSIKQGAVDQEVSIQPAVDFDSLDYLYAIKN